MSSAPGIAVPGSSVPTSSLVTPGGAQGIQGIQGIQGPVGPAPYTVTTADFTMPPAGSSVTVTVQDASWVIVGEMLAVQSAGGNPSTAASLRCTAKTGNQLTLLYQPPTTISLASTMGSGLLTQVTGNPTDYVGGDNACHPLPFFYGTDTTNNLAYAVTVAASFALIPGVVVFVTPSNTNAGAGPTLNVNGTGAKTICTRTGVVLQGSGELGAGRTFGVVYDGSFWRVITPIRRQCFAQSSSASMSPTIECSGYDGLDAYLILGNNGATNFYIAATFVHCLGNGFIFNIQILNSQTGTSTYAINFTSEIGTTLGQRFVGSSANGAGTAGISLGGSVTITAGAAINPIGGVYQSTVLGQM